MAADTRPDPSAPDPSAPEPATVAAPVVEEPQSSDSSSPDGHTPQPGDLTRGWSFITLTLWALVLLALAAVWGVSAQLGLATWWLGPRGNRNIAFVRFLPFFPPLFMLARTIFSMRWNALYGVVSGLLIIVIGVFDFSRVVGLAWLEVIIGAAAVIGSIATLSGTYRRARA